MKLGRSIALILSLCRNGFELLMKTRFSLDHILCSSLICSAIVMLLSTFAPNLAHAADEDDIYTEIYGGVASNRSSRFNFGANLGYLPRNELGVGLFLEQHVSRDLSSTDRSGFRSGVEIRWFQEPFEFAGSVGVVKQSLRDGGLQTEPTVGLDASYLWALTPSIAALVRFNFLFLDQPGVIFYSGLGARALF